MKDILIFAHGMEIGGAEKALLGLLENIDYSKYRVDLFLMHHSGALLKYIPKKVNLLPEISEYTLLAVPIQYAIKHNPKIAFLRLVGKISAKKRVRALHLNSENGVALECSHKYTLKHMPEVSNKKYDMAISFLTPHYFLRNRVKANKYIAWIHTDYSAIGIDRDSELKMWNAYDNIVSISEDVTKSFVNVFPELAEKIVLIENILPVKLISSLAEEQTICFDRKENEIILLSIGRYCKAKNFDNIPQICSLILKNTANTVKWYIIGFGSDEELINSKIKEFNMQDNVILIGKKENPYPYIKKCDIYVQPSRYEGKCVAVREAQFLNKPVVITNYATSQSQLHDGVDGIIVPMDNEGCAKGISEVISNKSLIAELINNCSKSDYSKSDEILKLYLMEN